MMENLNKLYVSKTLKFYNRKYCRNFTVDDVAENCNTSRQTLVRLSGASSFDLVKRVILMIYGFYYIDFRHESIDYERAVYDIMLRLTYGYDE